MACLISSTFFVANTAPLACALCMPCNCEDTLEICTLCDGVVAASVLLSADLSVRAGCGLTGGAAVCFNESSIFTAFTLKMGFIYVYALYIGCVISNFNIT